MIPEHGRFFALVGLLGVVLLGGCSHYQMGSGEKPPFDSVAVSVVQRETIVAQIVPEATAALRQAFQQTGGLSLLPEEQADVTLSVRLVEYRRDEVARDPDDTRRAIAYELVLVAEADLIGSDGTVYFQNRRFFTAEPVFAFGQRLIQSEREAVPVIVESLARDLRDAVTGVW